MADIDLLIALTGDGTVKSQLASVQQTATKFRGGLVQASAAMHGFDNAMSELNKTGKVSQATVSQLTMLLPMLTNPVTAVAVGIAAVVSQIMRWKAEQKELSDEMTNNKVNIYLSEAEKLVHILTRQAGATGKEKELLGQLAEQENIASEVKRNYVEQIRALGEEEKRTGESQGAAMKRATDNYAGSASAIENRSRKLKEEIDALNKNEQAQREANERLREFRMLMAGGDEPFKLSAFEPMHLALTNAAIEVNAMKRQELIAVMEEQRKKNQAVTEEQQNELSALQAQDAALQRQADTYRFLGAVAQDAIGGAAAGAFNAYADAMDKTVSLNAIFAGGFDRALRNQASAVIRSVGQQAAVRSVFELAEGFAALGSPFTAPYAGFHFKAAALFGGIALGAGVGAGLASVKPAGSDSPSGAKGGAGGDTSSRGGPNISVVVIGNLDTQARKDLGAQLRQEWLEGGG